MARNNRELFSSNRGVSHLHEACRIDDLVEGLFWGMKFSWWHPVASGEALDVLYRAMRPTLYHCIAMSVEIASDLPSFLSTPISLSPTTVAK
jgi:hypothetical protein